MDRISKEREFEEIMAQYGGIVTKICYYFSADSEEFKDLRQEVLCNVWKGLDKFRHDSKLSTWIYRVCFNTCVSFQRKERKYEKISLENILDIPADPGNSKLEDYTRMHALIRKLKFEERAIILMWLDDMSYEEISDLTGIKRNTVAVRLKRIKEKLIKMADN